MPNGYVYAGKRPGYLVLDWEKEVSRLFAAGETAIRVEDPRRIGTVMYSTANGGTIGKSKADRSA